MPKERKQNGGGQCTTDDISVRTYDAKIRERFGEVARGIEIIKSCDNFAKVIAPQVEKINNTRMKYDIIVLPYIVQMDHQGGGGCTRAEGSNWRASTESRQFFAQLSSVNIDSILWEQCHVLLKCIAAHTPANAPARGDVLAKACALIEHAVSSISPLYNQSSSGAVCDNCGAQMLSAQPPEAGENVCGKCGCISSAQKTSQNDGAAAESCADGPPKARRNGYHYERHLKIWLDRLQAIEPDEFKAEDIARVKASIASEYADPSRINWLNLKCGDIERHLKLCRLSNLHDHSPKILKEIGGRAPPILDYDAERVVTQDFAHIMEIYATVFAEPGNKPYYPFFIAKIIKRRFKEGSEVYRMVNYISHQGTDTINKNDRIYKKICDNAPEQYDLIYEPEVD